MTNGSERPRVGPKRAPAAGRLPPRPSHSYRVGPAFAGMRLDRFLQRMIPKLSRTRVQRAIASRIRLSWDAPLKPSTPVVAGGLVHAFDPALAEAPRDVPIPVLFEDRDALAVDKPAGLVVHPTHGHNANTVITMLRRARDEPGLTLAHRLDAETSGVLLLGRHRWAARRLQLAFERGRVAKRYDALVHGHPPERRFAIETPIGTWSRDGFVFRQSARAEQTKSARTEVEVVREAGPYAMLSVTLITGRRHQIRAHLAEIGHPLVGDKLYGLDDRAYRRFLHEGKVDDDDARRLGAARTMLHARSLEFPSPRDSEARLAIEAPRPADFEALLAENMAAGSPPGGPGPIVPEEET